MSSRQTQERLLGELENARNTFSKTQQELQSTREAAAAQLSEHRCKVIDLETGHQRRDEEQNKTILQLRQNVATLTNQLSHTASEVAFAQEKLKHEKMLHQSELDQAIAKEQSEAMLHRYKQESEITLLTHRYDDAKRVHEQDKQLSEKLHADAVRKLQIEVETQNRAHVTQCEQVKQRETDALQRLQTEHGRELRSAHEDFENYGQQLRTEMKTMNAKHSRAAVGTHIS